jgi:hypothetical protein
MAGDEPPRIVATFDNYFGMIEGIRARIAELQVTGEEFAGLPKGYLSKLIGVRPQRRIHMLAMGPIFGALGIYCVMFEDAEATARLRARLRPRNNSYSRRSAATYMTLTTRFMQKIGRRGAQARVDNSTKEQRQEWARQAAIARWRKPDRWRQE